MGPILAFVRRDLANFRLIQGRPAFWSANRHSRQQMRALGLTLRSSSTYAGEFQRLRQMSSWGAEEPSLWQIQQVRDLAIAIAADALAMLFQKLRQLGFRHAEM